MELAGRVALVTGGGRRLGRALGAALAGRGMTLAIHHHQSAEGASQLCREIVSAGGTAERFEADLTNAEAARALPERVARRFGRLDVLINSAAIMKRMSLEETTAAAWDEVMNVNLRAAFFCAQGAAPALRAAGGRVINLADVGALEPWPNYAAYCVSKAGVIMLTKVLARILAPEVTVNSIAPGAVLLPEDWPEGTGERLAATTPLRRLGHPEDIVAAMLYLLEGGDYVTGETIVVDGGRLIR